MSSAAVPRALTTSEKVQRTLALWMGRTPQALLRVLAKAPTNAAGETMAPEVALTMQSAAKQPDYSDLDPALARKVAETEGAVYADRYPDFDVVEDLELPGGLAATRYRARRTSRGLVVFFHGGGFVLGSRSVYDSPARFLALHANVDVLSVEYRLAPEHPFPAAHEDALVAWKYAVAHAPVWGLATDRIVISGDSAGANLVAVLAQQLRGHEVQPALQVMLYPVTDLTSAYPSQEEFADSPALTAKQIDWFIDHYLPEGTRRDDPRVSPMATEDLSGLPPAVVTVAGFDPLRDEGIAYAERLTASGVPVELIREPGLVHGYISFTAFSPASRDAVRRVTTEISRAVS
ncbi:alpha/beta hydrolase [Saccharopolyspora tripterygii]